MNAPFTALDVIVFIVIALSGALAMLRGFTREVLSILSWVVAFAAAGFVFLKLDARDYVRTLVQPDWLADAVLVGGTFLIVLIVISFITVRLTDFILDSKVGAIDRTLGLVFGVARGLVLVAVAYLFFAWLVPLEQQPAWVRDAQARPFMESSREMITSFLPEDPSDLLEMLPGDLRNLGRSGSDDVVSPPDDDVASPPDDDATGQPSVTPNSIDPDTLPLIELPFERDAMLMLPVSHTRIS